MHFFFATRLHRIILGKAKCGCCLLLVKPRHRAGYREGSGDTLIETMTVYVSQREKWKEKGKDGFTQIWHHQNRTWFIPSNVCVCMCAPLLFGNEGLVDHRVTHTKRFLPEDMWYSENESKHKTHASWHYRGQSSIDLSHWPFTCWPSVREDDPQHWTLGM